MKIISSWLNWLIGRLVVVNCEWFVTQNAMMELPLLIYTSQKFDMAKQKWIDIIHSAKRLHNRYSFIRKSCNISICHAIDVLNGKKEDEKSDKWLWMCWWLFCFFSRGCILSIPFDFVPIERRFRPSFNSDQFASAEKLLHTHLLNWKTYRQSVFVYLYIWFYLWKSVEYRLMECGHCTNHMTRAHEHGAAQPEFVHPFGVIYHAISVQPSPHTSVTEKKWNRIFGRLCAPIIKPSCDTYRCAVAEANPKKISFYLPHVLVVDIFTFVTTIPIVVHSNVARIRLNLLLLCNNFKQIICKVLQNISINFVCVCARFSCIFIWTLRVNTKMLYNGKRVN